MKKITIILLIIVFGLGAYLLTRQLVTSETKKENIPVQVSTSFVKGKISPEVTFVDFEGTKHNLSDFRGKAVVLDFWATWCSFCVAEMSELQAAQDEYKDSLVMIGVHRTDTESKSVGLKFIQDNNITYLLVSDIDGSLYQAVGGFGMPVAVFIDKDGVVTEIKSGPKTTSEIKEKIGELVN